jgi:hypothetical protein
MVPGVATARYRRPSEASSLPWFEALRARRRWRVLEDRPIHVHDTVKSRKATQDAQSPKVATSLSRYSSLVIDGRSASEGRVVLRQLWRLGRPRRSWHRHGTYAYDRWMKFRMGRLDHVHVMVPNRAEAARWYEVLLPAVCRTAFPLLCGERRTPVARRDRRLREPEGGAAPPAGSVRIWA